MKVEKSKANSNVATKRKVSDRSGTGASKKAAKDPNKPKRPPSAFFVFMEDFRKEFKENNPNNKSFAAVGKAGGEKWRSMSDAEKASFTSKAETRKTEYTMLMTAYNKQEYIKISSLDYFPRLYLFSHLGWCCRRMAEQRLITMRNLVRTSRDQKCMMERTMTRVGRVETVMIKYFVMQQLLVILRQKG